LINTKLRPPRLREGYLTRPRLLAQLDSGLATGFILISAPAGYGKTSLVVDWLAQRPALAAAWVSLDASDNDLDVFLRYLTTAVHNAFFPARPCANTQALLDAPQPPPTETIAGTLINDLAHLPQPLLLILDDYHLITHPAIRQVMTALVRHLPSPLRLLLITRMDLALPLLARRRAQQQLLEVRAADLRLATAEARAVLTQTSGAAVDEATVALLEEQTEGWVIGLQLAGLSLREQAPAAFARAFQGRHHRLIMDFLLDEVLALQPRPVLDFLLKTAILERICDSLSQAVTGEPPLGQESFLTHLAHSGLFLVSLDEEGLWYRYHPLFQALLRRRLEQESEPAAIAALHGRAGAWLAAHGFDEEALRHWLAAGDVAAAVALIEDRRHALLNQGEMHRLTRWLGLLPPEAVARRPALLQLKAWTLRWQAKFQAVPPLLQQAEALLAQETAAGQSANSDILRGERDILRAEMAFFQNEFRACLTYTQSALSRLPPDAFFARGLAVLFQLLAQQHLGQTTAAVRQLNTWLNDEQFQHYALRHALLLAAGGIFGTIGDLKRLEQVGQSLLNLGLDKGKPLSITWASHFLGYVYYQWNRLEEAQRHWSAVPEWRYQAHFRPYHEALLGIALLHHTRGDRLQARQTLDALTQVLLAQNQLQFLPEVESFRARLALLRGDVGAAAYWAQTGDPPARLPLWFWEGSELTRVKVLMAQNTTASRREAAGLLAAGRRYAEETGNVWLLIQVWALTALLARAQEAPPGPTDSATPAEQAAERAVRLAEPGGYLRLFVELGDDMAELLARLAARGVAPDYIGRLLAAFPAAPRPEPEALTRREREILVLLRAGLSDQEIAGRLTLSVLTVKKHNRHIYHKLGVAGRRQAVAMAETLNLIV
jgi:LuxR family maltose regulon positive regulatory protein